MADEVFLKILSGSNTTQTNPSSSGITLKAAANAIEPEGPAIMLSS